MSKINSYGSAAMARKTINEAKQALVELEAEKATLPGDTYLRRKQDLTRQVSENESALKDFNERNKVNM